MNKEGSRNKRGRVGLHFFLINQVSFSRPRNIFPFVEQTFSHPVSVALFQFYFQIIMHYFTVFIFSVFNIRAFTAINDALR